MKIAKTGLVLLLSVGSPWVQAFAGTPDQDRAEIKNTANRLLSGNMQLMVGGLSELPEAIEGIITATCASPRGYDGACVKGGLTYLSSNSAPIENPDLYARFKIQLGLASFQAVDEENRSSGMVNNLYSVLEKDLVTWSGVSELKVVQTLCGGIASGSLSAALISKDMTDMEVDSVEYAKKQEELQMRMFDQDHVIMNKCLVPGLDSILKQNTFNANTSLNLPFLNSLCTGSEDCVVSNLYARNVDIPEVQKQLISGLYSMKDEVRTTYFRKAIDWFIRYPNMPSDSVELSHYFVGMMIGTCDSYGKEKNGFWVNTFSDSSYDSEVCLYQEMKKLNEYLVAHPVDTRLNSLMHVYTACGNDSAMPARCFSQNLGQMYDDVRYHRVK